MALYKIIIADDEKEIRDGIIRRIDWQANGFQLVGDAANGQEAWELVELLRPDVVMTDIKMPFLNGLELGERIAAYMPLTKLVLFSGFDDFEYAKRAIKMNATEYILKPIDAKELGALLQKLKLQLDKEMDERRNVETLRQNYIQSLPILRQQFLTSLMEGKYPEGKYPEIKILELAQKYRVSLSGSCWAVAVVRGEAVENGGQGSLSGSAELVPLSLQQIVTENLARLYDTVTFIYNDDLVIIAMFHEKKNVLNFVDAMNGVCATVKDVLELSVTVGIGSVTSKLSQLRYSFEGAVNALEYRVLMGNKAIYIEDMEPDFSGGLEFDEEGYKELLSAIKVENAQTIRRIVDMMIDRFQKSRLPLQEYQSYMTELLSEFIKMVRAYQLDRRQVFGEDFKGYFHMQDYESMEDLGEWIYCISIRISSLIQRERKDSAKLLAEKTKEFVNLNFSKSDVSVEMLCSYLHVSPAYFSTIFKRETGMNFVTYLTEVRMREAEKLLNTTDDKTYVISLKVGYTEPNYFSYVFKKHFGVSPSKYRANIQNKEYLK